MAIIIVIILIMCKIIIMKIMCNIINMCKIILMKNNVMA
jgi:hypothetical protein